MLLASMLLLRSRAMIIRM